jgi:uncharacterized protein YdeI (BOF family)
MSVLIRNLKPGRSQTIEGRVVRLVDEDDFVLRDRSGRILVEVDLDDRRLPLQSGERIRVVGRLDRDDFDFDAQRVTRPNGSVIYDRFQPFTQSRTVNQSTQVSTPPLQTLTETAVANRSVQVSTPSLQTLTGTIERLVDEDDFVLRHTSGQILIDVDLDDQFLAVQPGETVTITGRSDNDDADFDALRITRTDGSVLYDRLGVTTPNPNIPSSTGITRTGRNRNDRLEGSIGNDRLLGKGGADRLTGAAGDDVLVGGAGRDTLLGDTGKDQFVYEAVSQAGDRILDFTISDDAIDLRNLLSRAEYMSADPVSAYLRFNQIGANTQVQIDPDGNAGSRSFRTLVTLNNVTADSLTAQNFLV